jgi:tetratricopeptide (TPR) repeat protein
MIEQLEALVSRGELLQARREANRFLIEGNLLPANQGRLYRVLGRIHAEQGEVFAAAKMYELAWPLLLKSRDWDYLGMVCSELGIMWLTIGDLPAALSCFGAYLLDFEHYQRARSSRGFVHYNYGLALSRSRRPREAVAQYHEALEWFAEKGFTELFGETHQNLAWLYCDLDELQLAKRALIVADSFSDRLPPRFRTQQLVCRAYLLMKEKRIGSALALVEEVLNPKRQDSLAAHRGHAAWIAGTVAVKCGREDTARYFAELVANEVVEGNDLGVANRLSTLRKMIAERFGSMEEGVV